MVVQQEKSRPSPKFLGPKAIWVKYLAQRRGLDVTNYIHHLVDRQIETEMRSGTLPDTPFELPSDQEARTVLAGFVYLSFKGEGVPAEMMAKVAKISGVSTNTIVEGVKLLEMSRTHPSKPSF